jgi:hypothetical protein
VTTLEQIAAAVNGEVKTSAALVGLLEKVATAINQADLALEELKERVFDPGIIDADAPDKLRDAEIRAQRLHAALRPLQDRLAEVLASEQQMAWELEFSEPSLSQRLMMTLDDDCGGWSPSFYHNTAA